MTELKPCPFCGCESIDLYEGDYGNGVYCMKCGVMMGEPIHLEFRVSERVSMAQAIDAWNTRADRTCRAVMAASKIASTCSECGAMLANWAMRYCPNCGRRVTDDRQGD